MPNPLSRVTGLPETLRSNDQNKTGTRRGGLSGSRYCQPANFDKAFPPNRLLPVGQSKNYKPGQHDCATFFMMCCSMEPSEISLKTQCRMAYGTRKESKPSGFR
jgi:hypothetical protein